MKKQINIVPYDPKWPKIFEVYREQLQKNLGENCVEVYHIGSTSVPGLCAKPTVDIMCVVKDLKPVTSVLKSIGYTSKGEFNLPLRLFFNFKKPNDINLHIVNKNSGEINWNLCFRNYLRQNKKATDMYAKVKLDLLKQNPEGFNILHNMIPEYTVKKGEIILKLAKEAGFNGYRLVIANNKNEIESYKTLLNFNKINFDNPNVFPMCLYKGVMITAAAYIKKEEQYVYICKVKFLSDESKKVLLKKIKEWSKFHDFSLKNIFSEDLYNE